MRPALLALVLLGACTAEPLRDRPEGMLAPFPADEHGREVPWERMVPHLVRQSVTLAVKDPPAPPAASRARPLLDPRNEPVLVLTAAGAAGLGAPWPQERAFTLRPPTQGELAIAPLGTLDADASWDAWQPALAWLRAEAGRKRPGLQRYSDAVLIVADGSAPAADARAAAAVLTRMGAARAARVAVVGPDGLWAALPLPPATLPVAALEELRARARQERPRAAPASPLPQARAPAASEPPTGDAARLEAVLAMPIPGPRCLELSVPVEEPSPSRGPGPQGAAPRSPGDVAARAPSSLRAVVEAALAGAGPEDVVAVPSFSPTLAQYLDPSPVVGAAAAARVKLGDRCE